jgi:hypothetical protein
MSTSRPGEGEEQSTSPDLGKPPVRRRLEFDSAAAATTATEEGSSNSTTPPRPSDLASSGAAAAPAAAAPTVVLDECPHCHKLIPHGHLFNTHRCPGKDAVAPKVTCPYCPAFDGAPIVKNNLNLHFRSCAGFKAAKEREFNEKRRQLIEDYRNDPARLDRELETLEDQYKLSKKAFAEKRKRLKFEGKKVPSPRKVKQPKPLPAAAASQEEKEEEKPKEKKRKRETEDGEAKRDAKRARKEAKAAATRPSHVTVLAPAQPPAGSAEALKMQQQQSGDALLAKLFLERALAKGRPSAGPRKAASLSPQKKKKKEEEEEKAKKTLPVPVVVRLLPPPLVLIVLL